MAMRYRYRIVVAISEKPSTLARNGGGKPGKSIDKKPPNSLRN